MPSLDEDKVIAATNMWPHICDQGFFAINVYVKKDLFAHAHFDLDSAKNLHKRIGDLIDEIEQKQAVKH